MPHFAPKTRVLLTQALGVDRYSGFPVGRVLDGPLQRTFPLTTNRLPILIQRTAPSEEDELCEKGQVIVR